MIWLLIATGGALGAIARHGLSTFLTARTTTWTAFPVGTLAVNVIGCMAAGVFLGLASRAPLSTELRAFVAVGVLGGFTTFSAFGADTFILLQNGYSATAMSNVLTSVVLSLTALWIGVAVTT